MNLTKFLNYMLNININDKYIMLIFYTILTIFLKKIIFHVIKQQSLKINNKKIQFKLLQFLKIIINIIEICILYFLWEASIKNVITLISLISAAVTLSLKDIIFNIFSGIYIKLKKPFNIEDRIEINNYKGDVINIGTFTFELLEINEEFGNQSTGVVLSLPNSIVFSYPIKNCNKGFKYIWNEIDIKLELNSDLINSKKILYRIINNIDLINNIPSKMKNELNNNTSYRMYYNKFDPIIYTSVVDNHIELKLRYLVNPKKSRTVKSIVWNEILKEYVNNNISLMKD